MRESEVNDVGTGTCHTAAWTKHRDTLAMGPIPQTGATKRRAGACSVETFAKETVRVPRGTEQDNARLHHAAQSDSQFKMYDLFISGISL